ncbi:MAG: MBL fold metallo-hydrolase, partial [Clostridia bacterium]|nr:MBL fold metallo-hydrolase [Clostridia bacterium]
LLVMCGCRGDVTDSGVSAPAAESEFEVTVLNEGQADAMLLHTKEHNVIIDCGEEDDGDELVKYLSDRGVERIDYVFITHFDKDHVGGFPELVENIAADKIIVPDYEGTNSEYKKYVKAVEENGLTVIRLTEDMAFVLDDVMFEASPPQKKSYAEGDNDFSIAVSVTHGDNSFLFTGDAEEERISEIVERFGREYDFLKVPHHGRYNKNTGVLIDTVKPKYAVICDSAKNPAEDRVTALLTAAGSEIYCTKDGTVSVKSDGSKITVAQTK